MSAAGKSWMWSDSYPRRLLDILECERGWVTTSHLTMRVGASRNSTTKALARLKARGLVESRPSTYRRRWGHGDAAEHEWSAV